MSQTPMAANIAVNPSLVPSPLLSGAVGELIITPGGLFPMYGISVPKVVKPTFGRLARVSVITAGTTTGAIYDFNNTTGFSSSDQIATIPNATGIYVFDWACSTGITIIPGTGQVVACTYI